MILDFNSGWTFQKEGCDPVPVQLPHDAMLTETRRNSCPNGVNTGYFPGGSYLYEKTFAITDDLIGKSFVLHFEGVYQNSTVHINGHQAGGHHYGFAPFDVDISDHVIAGDNSVSVFVDNTLEPNCRWYSGSGIYRPVTLLIRDMDFIKKVHIETISIDPAVIRVETDGDTVMIYDGDTIVAQGIPGELTIPDARLWSAEAPNLYSCVVKTKTDEVKINFGVRLLDWNAKNGFRVNGKRVLLRGGCVHHDHGILGACEYRAAEERRITILKENGFNAIRIAHHPASQITLETCDRLGMYVMNESFDGWYVPKTYHDYSRWFQNDWKDDLSTMVESSRNHPCVIMYSIGNEVSETVTEKGIQVCQMLRDHVHTLDPSRPVTAGINVLLNVYAKKGLGVYKEKGDYKPEPLAKGKSYKERKTGSAFFNAAAQKLGKLMFFMSAGKKGDHACLGAAQSLDILGLNYASSRYDEDIINYPERIMVGSETMAADLPYNWERVKKHPQLIGDFVWAAWDYLGESCLGDWTYHSYKGLPLFAGQGMIDTTGKPLAAMAFMQVVWGLRQKPFIAVSPLNHAKEKPSKGAWQFTNAIDSWTWHGYEGMKTNVEVYADAQKVRLSLNGKEIGVKALKQFRALFHVPYEPGTLCAQTLDAQGNVIASSMLKTGGIETELNVTPAKTTLCADGKDLCFIPIEFADQTGTLKPFMEQRVEISVTGAADLAGFGSALCKTDEVFDRSFHNSYRGRCLAVLRAGNKPGFAEVTVKSNGVKPVTIAIEVR